MYNTEVKYESLTGNYLIKPRKEVITAMAKKKAKKKVAKKAAKKKVAKKKKK
jgi:hypothetical protein